MQCDRKADGGRLLPDQRRGSVVPEEANCVTDGISPLPFRFPAWAPDDASDGKLLAGFGIGLGGSFAIIVEMNKHDESPVFAACQSNENSGFHNRIAI